MANPGTRIPKPTTRKRSDPSHKRKHIINSWKEMLLKICEIMYKYHHEFRKVPNLRGIKRPYFTT